MQVVGLTAHSNWKQLVDQCNQFRPQFAVLSDSSIQNEISRSDFPSSTELFFGPDGIEKVASHPEIDTVVCGIVGVAGLKGTWAAIEAGKTVAVANKETLVVAGPLVMDLAQEKSATIIPVDSEHSAIFQAIRSGKRKEVRRVILTASGGPFRNYSVDQLENVTPEMALEHPTWNMGPKITVDSATMMNKALEIIEARWLFDLEADQIEVMIHPQSIIHSMVEFVDGSVVAQMSPPDMKLPIQYALTYPDRLEGVSPRMDWTQSMSLDLTPPDRELFPSLDLGFEVAKRGGSCGAVLNAANEVAVDSFLSQDMKFSDIPRACRAVLQAHDFDPNPSLDNLLRLDDWARKEIKKWISR